MKTYVLATEIGHKSNFFGAKTRYFYVINSDMKNKLMVFERKVLRKFFGPTKERDDTWRIKTND
jgi:hypothetical protein